jgi:hypothetical protein
MQRYEHHFKQMALAFVKFFLCVESPVYFSPTAKPCNGDALGKEMLSKNLWAESPIYYAVERVYVFYLILLDLHFRRSFFYPRP